MLDIKFVLYGKKMPRLNVLTFFRGLEETEIRKEVRKDNCFLLIQLLNPLVDFFLAVVKGANMVIFLSS